MFLAFPAAVSCPRPFPALKALLRACHRVAADKVQLPAMLQSLRSVLRAYGTLHPTLPLPPTAQHYSIIGLVKEVGNEAAVLSPAAQHALLALAGAALHVRNGCVVCRLTTDDFQRTIVVVDLPVTDAGGTVLHAPKEPVDRVLLGRVGTSWAALVPLQSGGYSRFS
jgi:hypothetical protein